MVPGCGQSGWESVLGESRDGPCSSSAAPCSGKDSEGRSAGEEGDGNEGVGEGNGRIGLFSMKCIGEALGSGGRTWGGHWGHQERVAGTEQLLEERKVGQGGRKTLH